MRICIDIDGTIAGRNTKYFIERCNQVLDLKLALERLEGLTYKAFLRQKEVINYRDRIGDIPFYAQLEAIEQEPQMLLTLPTLHQAVEGVTRLSQLGELSYLTVRKCEQSPQQDSAIQEATKQWLAARAFPGHQQVMFCMSLMNKLIRLYKLIEATQDNAVLIDDLYTSLLEEFAYLRAGHHPRFQPETCLRIADTLQRHLILV
ncbi:MAG: hypothetical protein J2P37_31255, partial [Ktedonobacteraceae bacterium]|nr:hypothetical protein [Ktedonobacteraceae bacterium]